MPSFLDCSHTCRSTSGPTCKEIWRLPSPWPNVWRFIVVETGPRHQAKDPKSLKTRKREMWRRPRGAHLGDCPGGLGCEKAAEEGQGWRGLGWKEDQEGKTKESAMPQLWWRPLLARLQGVEGN